MVSESIFKQSVTGEVLSKSQSVALSSNLPEPWRSMDFKISPLVSESNSNFLLQTLPKGRELSAVSLVLRVPNRDEKTLGADQALEFKFYRWAAKQDLSPEILWANKESGVLLTRYFRDEQNSESSHVLVEAIAQSLSKLHRTEPKSLGFDVKARCIIEHIDFYRAQLGNSAATYCAAHDLSEVEKIYEDVALAWLKLELNIGLCHCDLHRDNILLKHGRSYFVDWEYAALSPPILDVASLQQSYQWSPGVFEHFLALYTSQANSAAVGNSQAIKQQLPLARFLLALQSLYWALLHYGPEHVSVDYSRALKHEIRLLKC
ncbi:phosphotransferase [uncultured Pseudoteredinibacter sp.]|uniref:phosphotransferase n=1 Tax=uncultured Pseudoteredinibacter sp. TaxID=1641701 RepID=UPI00261DC23F|nr:phosphotransferase [uncultured Pseudoteredinibacter sp.]